MIYIVCAIRDVKGDLFGQPFFSASVGMAIRGFSDECTRPDPEGRNLLARHPGDFELYQLGTFDDQSGRFVLFDDKKQLVHGSDCVKSS